MSDTKPAESSLYETLLAGAGLPDVPHGRLRDSASVVLWRHAPGAVSGEPRPIEVFWVQRSPALRFMGGWHAFPGGALDPADVTEVDENKDPVQVAGTFEAPSRHLGPPFRGDPDQVAGTSHPASLTASVLARTDFGPDLVPGLELCALRELFEETGVASLDGLSSRTSIDATTRDRLEAARQGLLEHGGSLQEALATMGLRPDPSRLVFAGRWRTPPFTPVRFDNRFFLLHWPQAEPLQPQIVPGELSSGEWIDPETALDAWRHGDVITAPPILHILRVLAAEGPEAGLPRLRSTEEARLGPFRRFEFRPGVITLPLVTPTLPPAAHTNAFLVGHGEVVLIDPGSPLPDQQQALLEALAAARSQGLRLRAIWLTHHHPDHVGAVDAIRTALGVPVLAHPATAARLAVPGPTSGPFARAAVQVDGLLHHDQRITLAGSPDMTLRVLHTPGHAPGHLCFLDEATGSVLAGDLVAGLGTIVIDPPDGDMTGYLASLEAVAGLAPKVLFPAHGPPLFDAVGHLEELKRHRLWREEKIRTAWQEGVRELAALVERVYPGLDPRAKPLAERQVTGHLERVLAARGPEPAQK
ncbi:MAG: MBL fold metallo-hydrolase [Acidobacteria bacterium]|nr:MBL fold metallo-hydrolase [Acidobacteriota bacterium]